jgi:hypothetical protein
MSWQEKRRAVVLGRTTVEYAAGADQGPAEWEIWISFPADSPETEVYEAMVFQRSGEFYWEGRVNTAGQVAELGVNVVEEAGLDGATRLEILELDLASDSPTQGEYVERLIIEDPQLLDQLIAALDTDLQVTPKVACIPENILRFHLAGGGLQEFSYSCSGVSFLRGEQEFWQGRDYRPPAQFDALLQAQLATTLPAEVNLVEEAGLAATVKLEVYETVSTTVDGSPGVTEAQVVHRLTIEDSETIAQIVAALDRDLALGSRARVPTPYVLEFHLDDGTPQSLGYAISGENPGILRGEQAIFGGQDAEPPAEFEALLGEIVAPAGDRIEQK